MSKNIVDLSGGQSVLVELLEEKGTPWGTLLRRDSGILTLDPEKLVTNALGKVVNKANDRREFMARVVECHESAIRQMVTENPLPDDHVAMKDSTGCLIYREGKSPLSKGDILLAPPMAFKDTDRIVKHEGKTYYLLQMQLVIGKKGKDGLAEPLFDHVFIKGFIGGSASVPSSLKVSKGLSFVTALPKDKHWMHMPEPLKVGDIIGHGFQEQFIDFNGDWRLSTIDSEVFAIYGNTSQAAQNEKMATAARLAKIQVQHGMA